MCYNSFCKLAQFFPLSIFWKIKLWIWDIMSSVTMSIQLQYTGSHLQRVRLQKTPGFNTLGPVGYPVITNRYLCIKIIDYNAEKFGYNEHPLVMGSFFFCIFLLVARGTKCKSCCTMWKRMAQLECWLPRGWQVLHQRWISGNMYIFAKQKYKATHSDFGTKRRCHLKSKTGLSVAPQKGLI